MKSLFRSLICLAALAALGLAADPRLTAIMMPDAKLVAGINIIQARTSPFGQMLLANIKDDDAGLQKLLSATGFDPRKDIFEVMVATSGTKDAPSGLVAVTGIFNQAQITSFVRTLGVMPGSYNGIDLYLSPGGKKGAPTSGFAFLDSAVFVAGTEAELKAAIDRKLNGTGGLNPALTNKVTDWSGRSDAWMISTVPISGFGPFPNQGTAPGGFSVDSVRAATAGVKFGKVVEVNAEATMRSPEDAKALSDVVQFLVSMVKMNQNPKNQPPQQVTKMLETMQLSVSGSLVKVSFSMPESDLETLIAKPAAAKKATARYTK